MIKDEILEKSIKAFDEAKAILEERGSSYGGLFVEDYMPFGTISYAQMVHLKASRIVSGVHQNLPETNLEDSCLDLINYAAFMWAHIQIMKERVNK